MKIKSPKAIRVALNDEVIDNLKKARRLYPVLSDAEILKVGLCMILWDEEGIDIYKSHRKNIKIN